MPDATQFRSSMQQLDSLLHETDGPTDPAAQARLQKCASALLELHGAALQRVLEHVWAAGESGAAILDACARDEIVSPVLVLHNLHPLDVEARVRAALEKVGPYLASHGGHVELLAVAPEGVVKLRLEGSCHGCPSSRVTLRTTIEQEIFSAAPELSSIVVEGLEESPPPPSGFVPIERVGINASADRAAAAS